jgi:phosphoglycolate phosphatase-like HAD superfamily hydrolase
MKLVLFDIDGTLIAHKDKTTQIGFPRFSYAIKKVYGVSIDFSATSVYNGCVDKQIVRSVVPEAVFSQKEFDIRWPGIRDALLEYAVKQTSDGKQLYEPIEDAVALAMLLHVNQDYQIGLLSGNVEKIARWKLKHAGIPNIFSLELFSDQFDNRTDLAKSVFEKYRTKFQCDIQPNNIVVIGDSIHDIRCGKAIGAKTIAVATGVSTGIGGIHGGNQYVENLKQEHPDILVDSLMDKKVLDFFHVNRT